MAHKLSAHCPVYDRMTTRPRTRIGVIGAGIIGMSSAYRLQTELPNVQVTVVSEAFTPDVLSAGVGGLWEPWGCGYIVLPENSRVWSQETYQYLKKLALSSDNVEAGVNLLTLNLIDINNITELPWYIADVDQFRMLTHQEITAIDSECVDGYCYTTMACEPRVYLPWITDKYRKEGGKLQRMKVTDMAKFCDSYDIVINCTGLGAAQLVHDSTMTPIRGQLIKVKGVKVRSALVHSSKHSYVVPGHDLISLGGAYEIGEDSLEINEKTKQRIYEDCCKWEPRLKDAQVVSDWCGLRPSREGGVRLELDSTWHPTTKVIHNYGHAAVGVTLHWGCAGEVVNLARQVLDLKSKL